MGGGRVGRAKERMAGESTPEGTWEMGGAGAGVVLIWGHARWEVMGVWGAHPVCRVRG